MSASDVPLHKLARRGYYTTSVPQQAPGSEESLPQPRALTNPEWTKRVNEAALAISSVEAGLNLIKGLIVGCFAGFLIGNWFGYFRGSNAAAAPYERLHYHITSSGDTVIRQSTSSGHEWLLRGTNWVPLTMNWDLRTSIEESVRNSVRDTVQAVLERFETNHPARGTDSDLVDEFKQWQAKRKSTP